jgi:hypothetical protein
MPERCASRTMSAVLRRESGKPNVAGSSQAMAFICTMSSGGKNRGSPRARSLLQTAHALVEEPLAPQAHHVAADGESGPDLIIGQALRGQENHPGARKTSKYGDVYLRARLCRTSLSWRESLIPNGLFLGIHHILPAGKASREAPNRQRLYVAIFRRIGTKTARDTHQSSDEHCEFRGGDAGWALNSSSRTFAFFRSAVSKPSVNRL